MSATKIYVNGEQPATLRHKKGMLDWLSLKEAVLAWYGLSADQRKSATIKVIGGDRALYTASEIKQMRFLERKLDPPAT